MSVPKRYPEEFRRKVLDLVAIQCVTGEFSKASHRRWRGTVSSADPAVLHRPGRVTPRTRWPG
ncbi:hypothetical protein A5742_04475 [Mycolicibacterium fortuitum]|uniref:Transposase n=1 Tax=Mycolicibacterium fortuitum TaxID=1766 RepID=A0ABD6QIG8_MYCFO|nr:hypothetical protein [Mycolicibacterium fortuitum]OMC39748.1 hypothetical protein A5742_04475 [Mycolicibacterium fortuitum]